MAEQIVVEKYIEVQGQRMHYYEAGQGAPLVLLHGGGVDNAWLSWHAVIQPLAQLRRVITPDLPGYGQSARGTETLTMEYYLRFLSAFLDALNLAQVGLGGLSLGGSISLAFALQHPTQVERLILADSYGLQNRIAYHNLSVLMCKHPWMLEAVWAPYRWSAALAKSSLRSLFHNPAHISPEVEAAVVELTRQPDSGRAFMEFQHDEADYKGFKSYFMERLGEIICPTLIIHGENDNLVPLALAKLAHERIAGSKLVVLPDCGHWSPGEQPELFAEAVKSWLAV